ncbi:hypothetical protein BOTBODRAFT_29859 [Botryobasidium botryosum FD-172 SS1]|uniref:Protein kinase domain-containing protein n=1 Tax=Botryobasidium botryosum (strain FD-172 SS1) TaxID=930990 RepID=A0A067MSL3_BOTB1|nr:hypothetical protein BOTBODRAFT_29859 [Botryobasidium botryosum FD-172 SS1]
MADSSVAGLSENRDPFAINEDEAYWVERQPFLESRGYQLRPRYRPGWEETWAKNKDTLAETAISARMPAAKVMDATRTSDGEVVVLKKLHRIDDAKEVEITRYFSQERFLHEERNHCVPLLDVIDPEDETNIIYIVLPLLLYFDEPIFESVDDAVDFVRQMLEGLAFMHEKGVAHRDCARFNIFMDYKHIYPEGIHPQRIRLAKNGEGLAPSRRRHQVPFPKYYFIDFGISVHYPEGYEGPRLVTGIDGQDKTVPEIAQGDPAYTYDPFKVDICILGNLFKNELLANFRGLEFLAPLADRMTAQEPADRPSAAEAIELFQAAQRRISSLSLYRRLTPVDEGFVAELIRGGLHLTRRVLSRRKKA